MKDYIKKQSEIRDQFERELDFISAHWFEGDKAPFSFGGWRDECLDKFMEIVDTKIAQALAENMAIVRGEIKEMAEPYDGAKWLNQIDPERLIKRLSSLDKPLTNEVVLEKRTDEKYELFKKATEPLIKFMNDEVTMFDPHSTVIVTSTSATLLSGEIGLVTKRFLKD